MFLKVRKLGKLVIQAGRQLVKNCNFFDICATGMHATITGCSCVISMDLTVCHKQIEENWRQQIIVVAEHEFSNIEGIDFSWKVC